MQGINENHTRTRDAIELSELNCAVASLCGDLQLVCNDPICFF